MDDSGSAKCSKKLVIGSRERSVLGSLGTSGGQRGRTHDLTSDRFSEGSTRGPLCDSSRAFVSTKLDRRSTCARTAGGVRPPSHNGEGWDEGVRELLEDALRLDDDAAAGARLADLAAKKPSESVDWPIDSGLGLKIWSTRVFVRFLASLDDDAGRPELLVDDDDAAAAATMTAAAATRAGLAAEEEASEVLAASVEDGRVDRGADTLWPLDET
jgi:hypothetical protein